MIKKVFLTLVISQLTFAITAVVKVLEAPAHIKEDDNAPILQKFRKGNVIFINDNTLNNTYYKTITTAGQDAYIRNDYVKLITKDLNELSNNISVENDSTDYILDEPMPDNYPFSSRKKKKAIANIDFAQGSGAQYKYPNQKKREYVSPSTSIDLKFLTRAHFDYQNRLFYGWHMGGTTEKNEFELSNSLFTAETLLVLRAGPIVSYTFYRKKYFEIDTSLSFSLNYHRLFVRQEDIPKAEREERLFTGFSLGSSVSTLFIHKDINDSSTIDFIHGPSIHLSTGYNLKSNTKESIGRLWSGDSYSTPAKITMAYGLGILYRF